MNLRVEPRPAWPAAVRRDPLATGVATAYGLAFIIIAIRVCLRPEGNTVFRVFRLAGARWLASTSPYAQVGEYLYSPLAAACFAPAALLPPWLGGLLWRGLNATVFLFAVGAALDRGWFGQVSARGTSTMGKPAPWSRACSSSRCVFARTSGGSPVRSASRWRLTSKFIPWRSVCCWRSSTPDVFPGGC